MYEDLKTHLEGEIAYHRANVRVYMKNSTGIGEHNDIMASIKEWQNHSDNILASLSNNIVKRELFKVTLLDEPMDDLSISRIKKNIMNAYNLDATNVNYFVLEGEITNNAYKLNDSDINILFKDNLIKDLMGAADKSTISALCKTVKKYFYCHPKNQLI